MSAIAMATDDGLAEKHVEIHEIKVEVNKGEDTNVFININGELTEFSMDEADLTDKDKLAAALSDVPEELREKLIASLSNIHMGEKHVIVDIDGENFGETLNWVSDSGGERVVVMEFDHDDIDADGISHKVMKQLLHKVGPHVMKFKHGKITADSVIKMLSRSDFSVDELNEIQTALDAKR